MNEKSNSILLLGKSEPLATGSGVVPVVDLYHEYRTDPADSTLETTLDFTGIPTPQKVIVRSHVVSSGMRALSSPDYVAAIRRRQSSKILALLNDLASHQESDDFVVWTQNILAELRRLIRKIGEAEQFSEPEHEGNSCEILRLMRDSMLGRGWERLREADVRETLVATLKVLAGAPEIGADDVNRAFQQLMGLGLNPSVGLGLSHVEEEA